MSVRLRLRCLLLPLNEINLSLPGCLKARGRATQRGGGWWGFIGAERASHVDQEHTGSAHKKGAERSAMGMLLQG